MLQIFEAQMMTSSALAKGSKSKKDLVRDIDKETTLDLLANRRDQGTGRQQVVSEVSTDTLDLQVTPTKIHATKQKQIKKKIITKKSSAHTYNQTPQAKEKGIVSLKCTSSEDASNGSF